MKKLIGILLVGLLFAPALQAQQVFQFSQYLQNPYIVNPAFAGVDDNLDVSLSYRKQWAGIQDSPQTYYVSGNATLQRSKKSYKPSSVRVSNPKEYGTVNQKGKLRHAFGGLVAADEYGLFKRTMGALSYSVHLPLSKKWTFSFGPSVGIANLVFDASRATLEESDDPTFINYMGSGTSSTNIFDLNFAGYLYHNQFFLGYSSVQLLKNKLEFGNVSTQANLAAYHNFLIGYEYKLSRDLRVIPSALIKHTQISPSSFDVNCKLDYQDRFWIGASYRHQDAIVAMTGVVINDLIKLGYSFDITTSQLSNYSSGSHEIILGLKLLKDAKDRKFF